jgi:hypothetical protein
MAFGMDTLLCMIGQSSIMEEELQEDWDCWKRHILRHQDTEMA